MKEMTRRDFFKLSGAAALLIEGGLTGCSSNSLPVMFGDRVDMGDMYVWFTKSCLEVSGSEVVCGYTVLIYPKDGNEVTVKAEDFGMKLEGMNPKSCKIDQTGPSTDETTLTFNSPTEIFCYGAFIEDISNISKGSPEEKWWNKIKAYKMGQEKKIEMKGTLSHNGKKVSATTHEVGMEFGS